MGINQLKRVKKLNLLRKNAAKYYYLKLKDINEIEIPEILNYNNHVYHLYIIKIKKNYKMSRDDLFKKLLREGIRTSVHYKPLHKFTMFVKKGKKYDSVLKSEKAYSEIISLPMYPSITKKEQDIVIETIKNSL